MSKHNVRPEDFESTIDTESLDLGTEERVDTSSFAPVGLPCSSRIAVVFICINNNIKLDIPCHRSTGSTLPRNHPQRS